MQDTKELSGADLIGEIGNILDKNKPTGVIYAENPEKDIKSKIFLKDGQIVFATSTMHRARFGDLMIKKGIITPKELNTALKLQQEHPDRPLIGNILVEMGVISERVIPNLLFHQIELVIYEIFAWNKATVRFQQSDLEKDPDYKRPITENTSKSRLYSDLSKLADTKGFINSIGANLGDLLNIRKYFSNPEAVPKRILKIYPKQLSFDHRKILRAVDGMNNVLDIIILSDLDYFRTYQILFELAAEKVISVPGSGVVEKEDKTAYEGFITEPYQNPIEKQLYEVAVNKPVLSSQDDTEEPVPASPPAAPGDLIKKYEQMLKFNREEIQALKMKINEYENSAVVFTEELNNRVSRLPYHKKMMLSGILKNIMDMVETV